MTAASSIGEQITKVVLKRLESDTLVIPPLPAAATVCLKMLNDPKSSLKQVAVSMARDPLLSAQILRLANTAAYGSTGVKTLDQAVSRLGQAKTKSMILQASTAKLFESRDQRIGAACKGIWEHSVAVGLLARDLASVTGQGDGEVAYLAGLLHDIGKPIIAVILLEVERQTSTSKGWIESDAWIDVISETHRKVGTALAEKWNLPEEVQAAVRDCGDYDPAERHGAANFVRFANAVAKSQGIAVGSVSADEAAALIMVGRSLLGIDEDVFAQLTKGLQARAQEASA